MPEPTARITLTRRVWPPGDFFRPYKVVIDDDHVGTISRRETKSYDIPPGPHHLRIEVDFARSRDVAVTLAPGQEVKLTCKAKLPYSAGLHDWVAVGVSGSDAG